MLTYENIGKQLTTIAIVATFYNYQMHDYFQKVSSDIYLMDRGHFLETNNVFSPPPKMVVRQTPKLKVDIFTNHYSFVVFYVF